MQPSEIAENRSMTTNNLELPVPSTQRRMALSQWDTEGDATRDGAEDSSISGDQRSGSPLLSNADLVQLRVRVIALENLLLTLLAGASDEQLILAREMAVYISPRPGFTQHPLTIDAAARMVEMVERAKHFRS